MKLVRVYAVDDDGDRVGKTHVAWWDGDFYWLVCGVSTTRDFKQDRAVTGCKRCRWMRLSTLRKVRQMAIDYGMRA